MSEKSFGFSKNDHLKNSEEISRLLSHGIFLYSEHIKLCYLNISDESAPCNKLAVSVPKKLFKQAVKRNRIKRQMREVYRLNKKTVTSLSEKTGKYYHLILIYRSPDMVSYQIIKDEMVDLMQKIK